MDRDFPAKPGKSWKTTKNSDFRPKWRKPLSNPYVKCQFWPVLTPPDQFWHHGPEYWHFCPKLPQNPYGKCQNCQNFTKNGRKSDFSKCQICRWHFREKHEKPGFSVFSLKFTKFWHFSQKPMGKPDTSKTVKNHEKPWKPEVSWKVSKNVKNGQNCQKWHFPEIRLSFTVRIWIFVSFDRSIFGLKKCQF